MAGDIAETFVVTSNIVQHSSFGILDVSRSLRLGLMMHVR